MISTDLYEQKYTNLMRALNREKPTYVPTFAFPGPATAAWAGRRAVDLIDDPEEYIRVMNKVFDETWVDCVTDHGVSTTPTLAKAFRNSTQNMFGPDGTTIEHYQKSPMKQEEYDTLIADPQAFVKKVLLPQVYPWLFSGDMKEAKKAIETYVEQMGYIFENNIALTENLKETHGIVPLFGYYFDAPALDVLFDSLRGFSGTLTDLRRRPEKVKAALDAIWASHDGAAGIATEGPFPYAAEMPHMPAYLSPKQFDEYYWPHQKEIIEALAKAGNKLIILLEGKWLHVIDRFRDVPKDSCILMADDDDIIELHKRIGDWQIISGGCKLAKTRLESKEANLDYTKRVIDECAPGGGFLFGTDKNWIAPGDVNQNLIDVYNFAHEYGKY